MVSVLIVGFLSGVLVANGLPHFIRGTLGKKHQTAFGAPLSAVQNVVWGWLSMAVAAIIWHFAPMATHPRAAFIAVAVGVLLAGLGLATTWSNK